MFDRANASRFAGHRTAAVNGHQQHCEGEPFGPPQTYPRSGQTRVVAAQLSPAPKAVSNTRVELAARRPA
jgi:hypothetical protein